MAAERRFAHVNIADPEAVTALGDNHPAIRERRPFFPTTVVNARDVDRIFIEGKNNRKIGNRVLVGPLKGMPIYTLTLPERTTCATSCHVYKSCYGNAMHWSRRHAPGTDLEDRIARDIPELAKKHPDGFLLRLHVLGDFYSTEYVTTWARMLEQHPALHIYGYTAYLPDAADPGERAIGLALQLVKATYPNRFAVRWSSAEARADGATVIDYTPETSKVEVAGAPGLVCPAETQDTACCSTCGLCWSPNMRDTAIVFVKHGKGGDQRKVVAREINAAPKTADGQRQIKPLPPMGWKPNAPDSGPPEVLWVNPRELFVDPSYQRGMSNSSMRLIKRVVENWSWRKFKPPIASKVVTQSGEVRLEVMDGQHTAMAAASHPAIDKIPILLVDAKETRDRADAFLGHNRDRLTVTATQIHHSACVAGDERALRIQAVCEKAGVKLLRVQPSYSAFLPGESMAVNGISSLVVKGEDQAARVLSVLVAAKLAPIGTLHIRAAAHLCSLQSFDFTRDAVRLARAIRALSPKETDAAVREQMAKHDGAKWEALAAVWQTAYRRSLHEVAA